MAGIKRITPFLIKQSGINKQICKKRFIYIILKIS